MPLPAPILDDRRFQDIVDEAKKRIPHYCDEWTDHNVSDPGVTFIELFAWMTDILLYRLNQVPDRHYVKFMEMLGITLRGPIPARVPITFWLSAPPTNQMLIPAGTEVSTTQTESELPIVFTTDHDFVISPPDLATVASRIATEQAGQKRFESHNLRRLTAGLANVAVFSPTPQLDDALYLGFQNDLSNHVLTLQADCDPAGGAGIDPDLPPTIWEASSSDPDNRWQFCPVEKDTTLGLNAPGQIEIHLPAMGKYRVNEQNLYWVRVRVREISRAERQDGMVAYETTPRLKGLTVTAMGGTTMATHAEALIGQQLGRSTGEPGQHFYLGREPVLGRQPGEHIIVQHNGRTEAWSEVADFAESNTHDRHYTLDSVSGEIRFGPAVRQRDHKVRLYGAIPPRGANVMMTRFRTGGGLKGNVEANTLNTLKTAIPYVDRVRNRQPAKGGLDAESLQDAVVRAPLMLRSRNRAVTANDFEFLTRQALPAGIGRVKCLQPQPSDAGPSAVPGQVYVLVVPTVKYPAGFHLPDALRLRDTDLNTIVSYLDERRLLTTRLHVRNPAYRWVSVRLTVGAAPGIDQGQVETELLKRLFQFLNPLTGGFDGQGWPFGRDLFVADIYQALQGMPNVLFVRNVELYASTPGGNRIGQPVETIDVVAHGVIASGIHTVEFV